MFQGKLTTCKPFNKKWSTFIEFENEAKILNIL